MVVIVVIMLGTNFTLNRLVPVRTNWMMMGFFFLLPMLQMNNCGCMGERPWAVANPAL